MTSRGEIIGGTPSSTGRVRCPGRRRRKKTSANPNSRSNLLDNLVEDAVPIARGLSLLNSTRHCVADARHDATNENLNTAGD